MADDAYDEADIRRAIQQATYGALLDKIRDDRYPSSSMMNMVEEGMDPRQTLEYAQALLGKVRDDRFPSTDMLKRLINLT
jgi:hypothetical protein